MLSILTNLLSGGVTGLLGAAAQNYFAYKSKQLDIELEAQKNAHELELRKVDAQIMAQEWAQRTQVAQVEAEGKENVAAEATLAASFSTEPSRYTSGSLTPAQTWLMVLLDFFRGIVRPGLTLYLCILVTLVYKEARALLGAGLSPEQALGVATQVIQTILYLATTCVLWWFGSRNKQAPPKA